MAPPPGRPFIVYVPGLKPKPEHQLHREQVWRCMLEGVRRVDPAVAGSMAADADSFDLVDWTWDFYREHRDIALDLDDIEAVLAKSGPSAHDIEVVTSLRRRILRALYRAADHLPFLITPIANEDVEMQIRDLRRYGRNDDNIGEIVRGKLIGLLRAASAAGRPILLYGHSMGSMICYDTLWQLTHELGDELAVDTLLTTGSPLGQKLIQRRLKGWRLRGAARYPANVRHWQNVAAFGELTAIDMTLQNDFAEMIGLELVEDIVDHVAWTYYHMHGALNVHTEYGYLVNEVTARIVSDWWRSVT